jgi:hypothetical protein
LYEYPNAFNDVKGVPFDPLTISYTLPESVYDIVLNTWLLSVRFSVVAPFVNLRLNDPGSNFSLYLLLLAEITNIELGVIFPKVKSVFSSPLTSVLYCPYIIEEADFPSSPDVIFCDPLPFLLPYARENCIAAPVALGVV